MILIIYICKCFHARMLLTWRSPEQQKHSWLQLFGLVWKRFSSVLEWYHVHATMLCLMLVMGLLFCLHFDCRFCCWSEHTSTQNKLEFNLLQNENASLHCWHPGGARLLHNLGLIVTLIGASSGSLNVRPSCETVHRTKTCWESCTMINVLCL